jgi:antitoxin MazE
MTTTTIEKWGNSYAVRLPKAMMRKLNLESGHSVEIREAAHGRTFSITPVQHRRASLKEMLSRITNKNRHGAVEWGKPRGLEVW